MDEMTLTLNSPLTDEQWDMLNDFDFERTNRIWFHARRGKVVEFAKVKPILTNADRIRAMTDEELARFIAMQQVEAIEPALKHSKINVPFELEQNYIDAKREWLYWLKQGVDDNE